MENFIKNLLNLNLLASIMSFFSFGLSVHYGKFDTLTWVTLFLGIINLVFWIHTMVGNMVEEKLKKE